MRVGWDASHGEFTINDYYYFSKLKRLAESEGIKIEEVKKFSKLGEYDVIVINYPEVKFERHEVLELKSWVENGKKLILTAYYSNLDSVARIINDILMVVSDMRVNEDIVADEERNVGDKYFPVAFCDGLEVVMPCSASVRGGEEFVVGKDVFAARNENVLAIGTCVFWDNYSIDLADNRKFAIRLLSGEF